MYSIYLAINTVNNKVYVGQTSKTIEYRWKTHLTEARRGTSRYLYNAVNKYGEKAFLVSELASCQTKPEANNLERLWIVCLQSNISNYGYNLTLGGEGSVGYKPTPETLKKLSVAKLGKPHPRVQGQQEKLNEVRRGKKYSIELKQKLSKSHLGVKPNEETRRKMSLTHLKRKRDPEIGKKISLGIAESKRLKSGTDN